MAFIKKAISLSLIHILYRAAYERGDGFCSVRFADRELYEQAFAYFITKQKIVHYCKGLTSLYYLEDATPTGTSSISSPFSLSAAAKT